MVQIIENIRVIKFNTGRNGNLWIIMEKLGHFVKKCRIVFIPLNHKIRPISEAIIAVEIFKKSTDHKRGIMTGFVQHPGQNGGGGGLAVGSADQQGFFAPGHKMVQSLGHGTKRQSHPVYFHDFRVIPGDDVADHNQIRTIVNIFRPVSVHDSDALLFQKSAHGRINFLVRPGLDRQVLGKITRDGVYLEELEHHPAQYLPEVESKLGGEVVKIDLNQPMKDILKTLSQYPIKTRLSLTGTMIVARDAAHAKLRERLEKGEKLPDYFRNHPVYYAGPAKTPEGYASGAFGPTTAGRMDSFVDQFQAAGGSMVMLAKGNRASVVREACKTYGGFYLGSVGGSAANLAEHCIKKVEVVEYPELGMEAIWKIEVEDFPAFIIIDDKGNDFFKELNLG